MSKIKFYELEVNSSELKELNDLETLSVIGGYDDEEAESTRDIIQRAMKEAVTRSDMSRNGNNTRGIS
ncbi:MAG: hypothetical protein QNJ72_29275 [Pleurocapsa sp. MO_226.B13]|nr:hypothetical protein [Pleurocapsa sp. MO_226.B13]